MTTDIVKEFGERYGDKVAGYWFDGFYQCFEKYPDFSFREFFKVCKAGNPNRVIALNSWIYPNVSDGRSIGPGKPPTPSDCRSTALPKSRPRRGIALSGPADHGALLGAAEC